MMNVEYRYFGSTHLVQGHSGIVVASTMIQDNQLFIGYSFCHPSVTYVKREGKEKAYNRMFNDPIVIDLKGDTHVHSIITRMVVEEALKPHQRKDGSMYYPPGWAKRLFKGI